jgi:hypothetical protein
MRSRLIAVGLVLPVLVGAACSAPTTDQKTAHASLQTGTAGTAGTPALAPRVSGAVGTTTGTGSSATGTGPSIVGVTVIDSAQSGRDLILKAQLALRVDDVNKRVIEAETIARRAGGLIANEQVSSDPDAPGSDTATLTVRVPTSAYESTLTALSKLGNRLSAQRSVDDVTDQVIDTSSRLSTAKAGITRVRTLLNRASTLGQVISLESELTKRQADLESLERRLASLQKQVALATIDVQLSTSGKAFAAKTKKDRSGFVGGLRNGWDAFTSAGSAVLTAVGAALPFALLLATLIAAGLFLRRRRVASDANPG